MDTVAADAGVTVQTVVRKYGSKAGIVKAAHEHFGKEVAARRAVAPGEIDRAIEVLTADYESSGRIVSRLLDQEQKHPVLKPALNRGRRGHRDWLADVFAESLLSLSPTKQEARLDALVVATDVYVWKLVRLDMGRPVSAYKAIVKRMVCAALSED